MQPIIKDNFLPDYYLDTINEYIESSTFDWYLLNNIIGKENKYNADGVNFLNNQIGFYHNVYSQEAQSNLFMLTKPLLKLIGPAFDIDVEQVFRIRLGMFIPNGKEGSHYPHVDYDFEHKTLLFYTQDSDGETIIFNEDNNTKSGELTINIKNTPKKNQAILFDGLTLHSSSVPIEYNTRTAFNINLICKK